MQHLVEDPGSFRVGTIEEREAGQLPVAGIYGQRRGMDVGGAGDSAQLDERVFDEGGGISVSRYRLGASGGPPWGRRRSPLESEARPVSLKGRTFEPRPGQWNTPSSKRLI